MTEYDLFQYCDYVLTFIRNLLNFSGIQHAKGKKRIQRMEFDLDKRKTNEL